MPFFIAPMVVAVLSMGHGNAYHFNEAFTSAHNFTDTSPHHHHKHARHGGKTRQMTGPQHGMLRLIGPLPADFRQLFVAAAAACMNVDTNKIKILNTHSLNDDGTLARVDFEASLSLVRGIEEQAANPQSKLAHGPLRAFLISGAPASAKMQTPFLVASGGTQFSRSQTPVSDDGIDIDTSLPYGELEAFGREDTAQELTEGSIRESDAMVDQLERAEVSEEKRAVFRALTRLRGAAITSFDGVARAQTGNIDEYNKVHKWRKTHPVQHLADEEADVARWAFPDNADLLQTMKHGNITVFSRNVSSKF